MRHPSPLIPSPRPPVFPLPSKPKSSPPDDTYQVDTYQVKITDQKTGKVQIIEDLIDFGPLKEKISGLVNIQDYNGDGHPDIAVRIVGAYTQSADELYLFNPATRQFQTPPPLQGFAIVGNVEVIRKGCIRVEYKSSIMDYDEDDYCWKNGGWEMLRPQKHQRTQ